MYRISCWLCNLDINISVSLIWLVSCWAVFYLFGIIWGCLNESNYRAVFEKGRSRGERITFFRKKQISFISLSPWKIPSNQPTAVITRLRQIEFDTKIKWYIDERLWGHLVALGWEHHQSAWSAQITAVGLAPFFTTCHPSFRWAVKNDKCKVKRGA